MDVKIFNSIKDISLHDWTPLIGNDFPFNEYEFLRDLETGITIKEIVFMVDIGDVLRIFSICILNSAIIKPLNTQFDTKSGFLKQAPKVLIKIQRGFLPEINYSAHWIEQPNFRSAIGAFIKEEKSAILNSLKVSEKHMPYKVEE